LGMVEALDQGDSSSQRSQNRGAAQSQGR